MTYDDYQPTGNKKDHPIVEFYSDAVENKGATLKEGRPIFRDVEMVRIRFPADRNRTLVRPAHAEWKKVQGRIVTYAMRFPDQYKRFKEGQAPVMHGTPLSELTFLTEARRRMLRALDVYTAEQLAALEGQPLKNLGPDGRQMKEAAKAFLDKAAGSSDAVRLAAENAQLRQELEQYRSIPTPDPTRPDYASMDKDALKALIREKTGATPQGNPSQETLVRMAMELEEAA